MASVRIVQTFCTALAFYLLIQSAAARAQSAAADNTIEIVMVGDVGFSPSNAPVRPDGVIRYGLQSWADTLSGIREDIDGDLNFLNLETVVTARNDLTPDHKNQQGPFNFRTHPNGVNYLVTQGKFNLFSLANNHSMDYGPEGLKDTLKYIGEMRSQGLLRAADIGMNRDEASQPALIDAKGSRIGYAAIGIITNMLERHHATESKPGQIGYLFPADYKLVLDRLKSTETNYRMLSIHYGIEGRVRTDATQIAEWRRQAALQNGIDLIVGHHAHVVRGVEVANKSVIFYGLGNFLHHGTANITGNAICRNYGLLAKVYLRKMPDGHLETKAIVAIPVTDTHMRPRRFNPQAGAAHIHALNYLDSLLDNAADGAVGVRFTPQEDGSGLYCFPDAGAAKDRIAKLCERYTPAPPIPAALRGQIEGSCAG